MEGRVRIVNENEQVRGTHELKGADGEASSDAERKKTSEQGKFTSYPPQRDRSGHQMKENEGVALTLC
jgi:hypothetical protein